MSATRRSSVFFLLVDMILMVHSNDFCSRYATRCELNHEIMCREGIGGVESPLLRSSINLVCPYYNNIRSASWTFTNISGSSISLPQQSTRMLRLDNIDKSNEGVYTCTVTLPNNGVYKEPTEVFLHISGHAYFKSCAEAENGGDCTTTQHFQAFINDNVTFDTRVRYRDGGACGTKQGINYLALKKNGKNVYFCANFNRPTKSSCMDNDRFYVTNQGDDKFDFDLTMRDVASADAGEYVLELNLAAAEGYQSLNIKRKINLSVSERPTVPSIGPTVPSESSTPASHCNDSSHPMKDAVLVFRGEVLSNNSNVSIESLGTNEDGLLCVIPDERCCTDHTGPVEADFLQPDGTSIGADAKKNLYITRGKQMVRLNSVTSLSVLSGSYCCVVSIHGETGDPQCIHMM